MNYIIRSRVKAQQNWSGKEFGSAPAKIYSTWQEAAQAITQYWFSQQPAGFYNQVDGRIILIMPLSEKQEREMLAFGKIRW